MRFFDKILNYIVIIPFKSRFNQSFQVEKNYDKINMSYVKIEVFFEVISEIRS